MERLRDPSHVRALPVGDLLALFAQAGLRQPVVGHYRLERRLDELLTRSFPAPGGKERLRKIFEDSLADDALDVEARREDGQIFYAFPIAIVAAKIPGK